VAGTHHPSSDQSRLAVETRRLTRVYKTRREVTHRPAGRWQLRSRSSPCPGTVMLGYVLYHAADRKARRQGYIDMEANW